MLQIANLVPGDKSGAVEVAAFIDANSDPGIRKRSPFQLGRALESGLVLTIRNEAGICGCSFIYEYDDGGDKLFGEIGTMLVAQNKRGYGLQEFLAHLHLVQASVEEDSVLQKTLFAVVTPGTASHHILEDKVGLTLWSPDEVLVKLRAEAGVEFKNDKRNLVAPSGMVLESKSRLRQLRESGGSFRSPKRDEMIQVNVGWPLGMALE